MKVVVQNVCSTQIVHLIVHVYETNVKILVLEPVDRMQTAKWWITYHLALVIQAILETHSNSATTYHLNVSSYNTTYSYCHNFLESICCITFIERNYLTIILTSFLFHSAAVKQEPGDPCVPSPCGPNSQCRNVNGQAVCSCLPTYIGSPPGCRPECVVSSECAQNRACVNQKCVDPCPGTCGLNARCEVINHSPICSCQVGFTGDPFTRCFTIPRKQ